MTVVSTLELWNFANIESKFKDNYFAKIQKVIFCQKFLIFHLFSNLKDFQHLTSVIELYPHSGVQEGFSFWFILHVDYYSCIFLSDSPCLPLASTYHLSHV